MSVVARLPDLLPGLSSVGVSLCGMCQPITDQHRQVLTNHRLVQPSDVIPAAHTETQQLLFKYSLALNKCVLGGKYTIMKYFKAEISKIRYIVPYSDTFYR